MEEPTIYSVIICYQAQMFSVEKKHFSAYIIQSTDYLSVIVSVFKIVKQYKVRWNKTIKGNWL